MVITGIDPGIVHTGIVRVTFDLKSRTWKVEHHLVDGLNCDEVVNWKPLPSHGVTFIEAYKPRSNFAHNNNLVSAVSELRSRIRNSHVIQNTGVEKVIKPQLMKQLGVWTFAQRTHHNDLRSAARIGLYGMVKDEYLNEILYEFVKDNLDGHLWTRL